MTSAESAIRILVVDDHPVMREGIRRVIDTSTDMVVVGEAVDGVDAIGQFRSLKPDVTLMDLQMPRMGGVEAIEQIRQESPRALIIVLTTFTMDVQAIKALRAGARGYLLKNTLTDDLVSTIRSVFEGRRHVAPEVAAEIAANLDFDGLTEREVAVLRVIAEGNSNRDAAARLSISLETVKQHLKHIAAKLGTHDRTHAVAIAIKRGIIEP